MTQPCVEGVTTAEELVAYAARVSNPSNQLNNETAGKLLKYCINNHHWSVFETVYLTIEIKCTRTIGRQILRHRSFTFQEFSQRYAAVEKDSMFTTVECRMQDEKNRQSSNETDDVELADWFEDRQKWIQGLAVNVYEAALEKGIAKEQARVFLPEGNTMSHMYMTGSLRSWIHYCMLRTGNGTQKEHSLIAKDCWNIISERFPSIADLIEF